MDTPQWFASLLRGIDGPLGTVLDVGCAEGVMCVLAAEAGAESVLGIGLHTDSMAAARLASTGYPNIEIREQEAREFSGSFRTVVFSMMAHWLGHEETARFARMATRNFAVIFRTTNDHYEIPTNGTWFPTLEEMDATVNGVRTSETLLLTQDNGKEVWAATYRTDMRIEWDHGIVIKERPGFDDTGLRALVNAGAPIRAQAAAGEVWMNQAFGRDLHGDPPFRPTHGASLAQLTEAEAVAVRDLIYGIGVAADRCGWYPTDLSPRNIVVGEAPLWYNNPSRGIEAHLVDVGEIEPVRDRRVAPEFLPIWQRTCAAVGIDFCGYLYHFTVRMNWDKPCGH